MQERAIPLVNLNDFKNPDTKNSFIQKIGQAFETIGFVGVVGHGIPKDVIADFYDASHQFFNQPKSVKEKYHLEGVAGQRGYTAFGVEHAKQSDVPDLKEFFQLGQENQKHRDDYIPNVVVEESNFTQLGVDLYKNFENVGFQLLQAIATYLGLEEDYFANFVQDGNSILRSIHYPPITTEPKNAIRAESHEDINLITLLVGASAGGLQVLDKNENWLDVVTENDEIVINVGDMLERLTNNKLRSTTHRVVNPPREEWHKPRLSIPFFLHPNSDMPLNCLENCIDENHPIAYEPIKAGDFLHQRLVEIGLIKA